MWSFETEIDFNTIFYGDELILTLLRKGYLTNAFYTEGYENALQLTPKPKAMEHQIWHTDWCSLKLFRIIDFESMMSW